MGTTPAAIVNTALELLDSQAFITGTLPNFDGSNIGVAAGWCYPIVRDFLLRLLDPEFARIGPVPLVLVSGAPAGIPPLPPWLYEYTYPADGVRIRQVRPPAVGSGVPGAQADPWDPQPIRAAVAFDQQGGGAGPPAVPAKVILTNQQNALAVYTSNATDELFWDADYVEAFIRRLGQPLAAAISGRFDQARELLAESERYASLAAENREL